MDINYTDFENDVLKIIQSKKISSIKDIQVLVFYMIKKGFSVDDIKDKISTEYQVNYKIKDFSIESVIDILVQRGIPENLLKGESDSVEIYESEISHLKSVENADVRKILYLLLIIAKWSNHSSGWIRYDKKYLFNFWGFKYKDTEKTKVINECCKNGLDLRVVGSKNPIICFKLDFRDIDSKPIIVINETKDIKKTYCEVFEKNERNDF